MGTLGNYLREAREARGLDLREAAQQTRIGVTFLAAIESEEFSKLPGEVFVKGFLKNYARFLRLPEDEVMKRYAELRSPAAQAPAAASPQKEERKDRPVAQRPEPQQVRETAPGAPTRNPEPYLWGIVLAIALILFIVVARPEKQPAPEHTAPVSTPTETAVPATGPATTGAPDKIYLDIEALEDTWVLVRTDASPQKQAVLRKGESVTWSAGERFLLSYGSAGAVRLLLNGKELTVAGARNAVVRDLAVTAKGIVQQKTEVEQKPRKPKPPVTGPSVTAPAPAPAPRPAAASSAVPTVPAPASVPPAGPAAPVPAPVAPSMPRPAVPEG